MEIEVNGTRLWSGELEEWWGLLAIAVLAALVGLGDMISGVANDPGIPLGIVGKTSAELHADGPLAYRMYGPSSA